MKKLLAICVFLSMCSTVYAGDLYWDNDSIATGNDAATGAGLGGIGNWSTAVPARWWDGASATDVVWAEGNTAIFTGTAGTVTLSGPRSVNGLTFKTDAYTIASSTLTLTSPAPIFVGSGVKATITSTLLGTAGYSVSGGGTVFLNQPSNANTITGAVSVTGGSTLELAVGGQIGGTGSGSGNVTLNNGTLRNDDATNVANSFLTSNRTINIGANGGTLNVSSSGAILQYAGTISGAGTVLTKSGPGTLRVSSASGNVQIGKLVVTGGLYQTNLDLNFGPVPGSATADAITLDGGGISSNSGYNLAANRGITINSGGGTINTSSALNVLGKITGSGNLTKSGASTLTLTGVNNYTGNTLVNAGKLSVANASALGSAAGNTQVASAAELLFDGAANSFTISEPISIAGIGAGDGGAITVQNSSVTVFTAPITLTADAQITTSGTGTATYSNASAITGADKNLTVQGGSGAGGGSTVSGAISLGTGKLTKLQGGTWTLSNASGNSYSGGTTIGGGTLTVTNTSGSGTGSGDISVGSGTTAATFNVGNGGAGGSVSGNISFANTSGTSNLNFNHSSDSTYAGTISGSNGNVTKSGAGVLTLSNANTYTGSTTINGGTLKVANVIGSATGSGAVVVNSGGTLAGIGAVAGPITVNSGGTVAPGNSPGVLNVGAITFNAGSIFQYEVDSNAAPASSADLINANGNLAIAAAGALLNVTYAGTNLLSKLTLVSYAGAWNGNVFDGFADDSVVTLGGNQYVINYNDVAGGVNFGGGIYGDGVNPHFLTLTAVPEAGAFVSGCLVCGVIGLGFIRRKLFQRRAKCASAEIAA